jgi:CubicO group peptidase (beta-lactamase class C family)
MSLVLVLITLIAIIILYFLAPHASAIPTRVDDVTELEFFLNRLVKSGNPPGLSVIVVKNGRIVYNNAFGFADGPRGKKAETNTVYHWWSMTKIPTAIAIMQLQEKGELNLDDAVTKHLPWFEVVYPY